MNPMQGEHDCGLAWPAVNNTSERDYVFAFRSSSARRLLLSSNRVRTSPTLSIFFSLYLLQIVRAPPSSNGREQELIVALQAGLWNG